jgi:hypothetical protein
MINNDSRRAHSVGHSGCATSVAAEALLSRKGMSFAGVHAPTLETCLATDKAPDFEHEDRDQDRERRQRDHRWVSRAAGGCGSGLRSWPGLELRGPGNASRGGCRGGQRQREESYCRGGVATRNREPKSPGARPGLRRMSSQDLLLG